MIFQSLLKKTLTRFLCGIPTPLSSRFRAAKMVGFEKLEAHPFKEANVIVKRLLDDEP